MPQQIQLRRGTAAQWTASNPILLLGERGVETDTGFEKSGDGITLWASLPYMGAASFPGGTLSKALNFAPPVTIASSSAPAALAIGAAASNIVLITGTTPITGFDQVAPAGSERETTFAGVLTLTNSATLVCLGGADIPTAAGDIATWRSLGGALGWTMVDYQRASGKALVSNAPFAIFKMNGAPVVSPAAPQTRYELARVSVPAGKIGINAKVKIYGVGGKVSGGAGNESFEIYCVPVGSTTFTNSQNRVSTGNNTGTGVNAGAIFSAMVRGNKADHTNLVLMAPVGGTIPFAGSVTPIGLGIGTAITPAVPTTAGVDFVIAVITAVDTATVYDMWVEVVDPDA